MKMKLIALAVSMIAFNASATSKDCGCTKTPTAYDKTQDVKISGNTSSIGDVKITAGQAFDIAVEGRATAGNALTTVYGLIPQVNNNAKGIADLQASKVDKLVFTADQQRQDKALAATVTAQAGIDAKQSVDLKGYADKKATSAYQTAVSHTDVKVARADADRKAGDDALGARITAGAAVQSDRDAGQDNHINAVQDAAQSANVKADGLAVRADGIERRAAVTDDRSINNAVRLDGAEGAIRETHVQMDSDRQQRIDGDAQNSAAISQEARTRASQVVQLSAGISQAQATGDYAASRADQAFSNAAANSQSIRRTNERVAEHSAQLANHEQRITGLEQKTNRDFANMGKRIDDVRDRADGGVASVAAMSSIPQLTEYQRFNVGAGVGIRHGQQAVAIGFSSRAAQNVIVKASAASDTTNGWTIGGGLAIGW